MVSREAVGPRYDEKRGGDNAGGYDEDEEDGEMEDMIKDGRYDKGWKI